MPQKPTFARLSRFQLQVTCSSSSAAAVTCYTHTSSSLSTYKDVAWTYRVAQKVCHY